MSDHDAAPDPIDKAYAEAEAVLSDDSARAARRARILAAVAKPEEAQKDAPSRPAPRPAWQGGGWLVAASVAALSVFVATQIDPPIPTERAPAPPPPAARSSPAAPPAAPREPAPTPTPTPTPTQKVAPPAAAAKPAARARVQDAAPRSQALPAASPPPPPPPALARAPAAPAQARAEPPAAAEISELVVTATRIESRVEQAQALSVDSPSVLAARLRAAAAAGRSAEVEDLLAKGVPVDAADDEGETALMKSIHAEQPAVAALLRRHGASLDRKNRAGASARDMAARIDDAELNEALGLGR